jgi:hypothetical protein
MLLAGTLVSRNEQTAFFLGEPVKVAAASGRGSCRFEGAAPNALVPEGSRAPTSTSTWA